MKKWMQVAILGLAVVWAVVGVDSIQARTLKPRMTAGQIDVASQILFALGDAFSSLTGPLSPILNPLGAFLGNLGCALINC